MTDGPHKSLAMLPRWRKVAEYADKAAFDQSEIDNALQNALTADFRQIPHALITSIQGVMNDPNDTIFREFKIQKLEAIRAEIAGSAFSSTLLDSCIHHLQQNAPGPNALAEALTDAYMISAANQARAMEEHFHRKAGKVRAGDLRNRLETALGGSPYKSLAHNTLANKKARMPKRTKQSGLDDGVSIR